MDQTSLNPMEDECAFDIVYLTGLIVKAMENASLDPETPLMYARKSAEFITSNILSSETGHRIKQLIKLPEPLCNTGIVPERISLYLRSILHCGDQAAHVQRDHDGVQPTNIDQCLTALIHVVNWYFLDYLHTEIPSEVVSACNEYEPIQPLRSQILTDSDYEKMSKAMELPSSLHPYQWEGVGFLVNHKAALLADQMGLGKTVQAIIALRVAFRGSISKRALVVTPSSIAINWEREFAKWAPSLVVRKVMGSAEDRRATYMLPIQVLIATYDQIRSDGIEMGQAIVFDVMVLDEAQRIKNRHSLGALACRLIRRRQAWALTGTPLENSIEDLSSIFLFLKPGLIDSGMPPSMVHKRIRRHFFRRRKREVLEEIPPIIIQDIPLQLAGDQKKAYSEVWVLRKEKWQEKGIPVSQTMMLALVTKLKQLCNYDPASGESVKWETLLLMLEALSQREDKVIVFSQYVDTLKFLSRRMETFPHSIYSGDLTKEDKDYALRTFKSHDGPRALLMSLRAGGVGLNIQEASTVVLFDRWWNPSIEEQAIHRAHRFGRERPLHVIRFLVVDTVEERINDILQDKRMEFESYVESADNATAYGLTSGDLRRVLGLSSYNANGL